MFWGRVFIASLASVGVRAAQEGSGAGSAGSGCTRQQTLDTCVYFPSLPNLQANTHPRAKMLLAETAWEISAHPHPGGGGVKQRGWEQHQDTRSLPPSLPPSQLPGYAPEPEICGHPGVGVAPGPQAVVVAQQLLQELRQLSRSVQDLLTIVQATGQGEISNESLLIYSETSDRCCQPALKSSNLHISVA